MPISSTHCIDRDFGRLKERQRDSLKEKRVKYADRDRDRIGKM
jgi:hypothetical protein